MNFKVITKEEFRKFSEKHEQESFMQTVELGDLKEEFGNITHYVGVEDKNKLIAATLLLEVKSYFGKKTFYAPRGFLIDYNNLELLKFFNDEVKKYIKKHKGFMLTIDPNVVYRVRSSEGEILNDDKDRNDKVINNLTSIGYKHFGFNKYLETMQARWEYRLKLDRPYEEISKDFSKSTRKNIESCYKKGLMVRLGKVEDLPSMEEIFESTSKRKDFFSRSLDYYQKMYKHMHDLMTIYIAYLDPDVYYNHTETLLNEEKKNNDEIAEKLKSCCVGSKLTNQKETSDNLLKKYTEELEKAKKFKEEYPNGKDVGVLLSMKSGNEYLTLSSGILEEYKSFTPKYALYDYHIKDAYKKGYEYVDFYGITGDFDKSNKYYGIYEFKKGYNGNVVELVGQFTTKVSSFYSFYNFLKKIKSVIKK